MNTAGRRSPALAAIALLLASSAGAANYSSLVAEGNRVGVTLTNYGVIGNNFSSRSASLECPLGTGYEHLTIGGLWIGAHGTDPGGDFTGVTSAALDGPVATPTLAFTEFTPAATGLLRRSVQVASPYQHPDALSDLDVIALFDDATPRTASWNPEAHRPLNVAVRHISHQWSAPDAQDLAIERFVVCNAGTAELRDVHVGLRLELASGPKSAYSSWPPTIAGSVYGSWYGRKLLGWDDSLHVVREHRCSGPPIPGGCQFEIAPEWVGLQLLTPPQPGQHVTLAVWNYSPSSPLRDQDAERFALMSAGGIADVASPDFAPGTGDPVELLALGPFDSLAPGDSLEVAFALVGGAEVGDLVRNARTARRFHEAGYRVVEAAGAPAPARLRLSPWGGPLQRGSCVLVAEFPAAADGTLDLLDSAGRRVARRELGRVGAGRQTLRLDEARGLAAGVYFARLTAGPQAAACRFVLLR